MKIKIPIHLQYFFRFSIDGLYDEYKESRYSKELSEAVVKVKLQAARELMACGFRIPPTFHVSVEGNYAVVSGTAEAINPWQRPSASFRYTRYISAPFL